VSLSGNAKARPFKLFARCRMIAMGLLAVGAMSHAGAAFGRNQNRPNIIMIVADDLGYGDLEQYGQTKIRTPTLGAMAQQGVRFTNFYAGSPACAPSRCTLMTGQNGGTCAIRTNFEVTLPATDVTIAERLKSTGYTTAIFGKWGLGDANTPLSSQAQGFDYSFGYQNQLDAHHSFPDYFWSSYGRATAHGVPSRNDNLRRVKMNGAYAPDVILREALEFMRQPQDEPYFLYYATTIPHANNEDEGVGKLEVPDLGQYRDRPWTLANRQYAALVSRLDDHVRQIWEAAQASPDRPTIIIVTADNGPHGMGGVDVGFFRSTAGLKGRKYSLNEGGIRVPMIVWGNGKTGIDNRPSYFPDLTASTLALAGLPVPQEVDGEDLFSPASYGGEDRALYWEVHTPGGGQWAVRKGAWKTVSTELSGAWSQLFGRMIRLGASRTDMGDSPKLYNLEEDPAETTDLSAKHPDILAEHVEFARVSHRAPTLKGEFEMFRRREDLDKFSILAFGGVVASVFGLGVILLIWKRRRRRSAAEKA
jgi:arylsulfatase A-like enzyme